MTFATIKAADAAQFLSLLPHLLGYVPKRSIVLVPFHGSRSLGAMRFDLPDASEAGAHDRFAATAIGMACRVEDADAVAVIAYTDQRFDAQERMPHGMLLDALRSRAEACGLRVTDALCVAADGWGSRLDPACPSVGRPLQEVELEVPASTAAPTGDQLSGAELIPADADEQRRVAQASAALEEAIRILCGDEDGATVAGEDEETFPAADGDLGIALGAVPAPIDGGSVPSGPREDCGRARVDPRALTTACRLDDLPDLFEGALTWPLDRLEPFDVAALAWCLSRPSLRDVALVQWSGDLAQGDEALDAQLRWEAGEEYPTDLAMRMWGEGDRPDVDRLEAALALVRRVAAAAPRRLRAGPLAMCAWLAWALGRSTHADAHALQACEIEPEHGLAEIVRSFVAAGHLPDWAFRAGR